jgi:NAD-specific glutamate dehydrogenase
MNFETISQKQLNDLEQQVSQLLTTIRRSKLDNEPLVAALQELARELEQDRQRRFDTANSEYSAY